MIYPFVIFKEKNIFYVRPVHKKALYILLKFPLILKMLHQGIEKKSVLFIGKQPFSKRFNVQGLGEKQRWE